MTKAIIMGGTGVIGRAVALRLLQGGWEVQIGARSEAGMPSDLLAAGAFFTGFDRRDDGSVAQLLSAGADLLVDCLAFTRDDVRRVLPHLTGVGSAVMLSSKAVYVDADGRHVNSEDAPRFEAPVREDNPVMAPSDINYRSRLGYGSNKVAAERAYLDSGYPVTVIRASKVHGVGALPAREWHVVRRILEERNVVFLRHPDAVDHTSAAVNIAALVETVAARPGLRVLNSADPDTPSVAQICRTIAARLGHTWREVGVPATGPADLGRTPWDAGSPIVLDLSGAHELGYTPVGDYAATVGPTVDWLVAEARVRGVVSVQPTDFFEGLFNYDAEDRSLSTSPTSAQ